MWLTKADARSFAPTKAGLSYVVNLKLKNPATAPAFATRYGSSNSPAAPSMASWQGIAAADGLLVQDEQQVLAPGAWLAALLAIASVAVLAGGRMAEHTRRIGLLKAVGGTPGLTGGSRPGRRMADGPADHQPRGRPGRHPRRAIARPVHRR